MKCIKNTRTGWILKVSNTVAKLKVNNESYEYVDRESHREQQENRRNGILTSKSMEEKVNGKTNKE